jgi:hypothetical protein
VSAISRSEVGGLILAPRDLLGSPGRKPLQEFAEGGSQALSQLCTKFQAVFRVVTLDFETGALNG